MTGRTITYLGVALTMAVFTVLWSTGTSLAGEARLNTAAIERLTGAKGELSEKEGVFKVSMPRSDLAITVAGVKMTPPLGLTSWAGFQQAGNQVMVMGDMVLLENQVNPVMSAALENGLEVTALHNHFLWDTPRVMFMHIGGMGGEATLAGAVGKVFATIQHTSRRTSEVPRVERSPAETFLDPHTSELPQVELSPAQTSLNPKVIEDLLGVKGQLASGVYKITLGRATTMHGHEVGNAMGVNTWAAFAGSDTEAIVDGDFVMLEPELQPVLKALRGAGINIVAIHHHMIEESPRTVFLHYWGIGPTRALAT
ncbi:MAG: DUF1259 domain-containing protein, partial [Actinomycetota bacterium]|nr:DUF1259 domain-containing protein [Actinomycetota bacterium]